MVTSRTPGIIFAADILEKSKLIQVIKEVSDYIEYVKLGNLVLYEFGWELIKEIKNATDRLIMVDLKLMDIPEIGKRISRRAYEAGADAITIAGPAGGDTIEACLESMEDKQLFIFTEFTHCTGLIPPELSDDYIDLARVLKCTGVQVPGTKQERIKFTRQSIGPDMLIMSCGIGTQSSCNPRKSNAHTNFGGAVAAGADYEIIGRAIYNASEKGSTPVLMAEKAQKDIINAICKTNC